MSTIFWDRLTPQEQDWLEEAVREATDYQRELWRAAEQEALDAVQAAGVQIIRPDKSAFAEKTTSLLEAYRDQPEMYELIQAIQAVE
jgi:TRAP-type C4-dicarboxylate transport system substrate-binding protein